MRETSVRWRAWARGMRRRWACRRVSRAPLDFVWLRLGRGSAIERTSPSAPRPFALRLSIARSITVQWASRIVERQSFITTIRDGLKTVPCDRRELYNRSESDTGSKSYNRSKPYGRSESRRSVWHAVARPLTLRTNRQREQRARAMTLQRFVHASSPLRWVRVYGERGRIASVPMTTNGARVEPRVLAPPPMIARTALQPAVGPAATVPPQTHDFQPLSGFMHDAQSPWMAAAAAPGVLSSAVLASVTDHVVREIDSRVRAKRERLGKV